MLLKVMFINIWFYEKDLSCLNLGIINLSIFLIYLELVFLVEYLINFLVL